MTQFFQQSTSHNQSTSNSPVLKTLMPCAFQHDVQVVKRLTLVRPRAQSFYSANSSSDDMLTACGTTHRITLTNAFNYLPIATI